MTSRPLAKGFVTMALLTAVFVLGGVRPSAALTKEEIANLTGPDRQKILEEGARKEGEVMWYTSLIVDQVAQPIADAFKKKYPYIKFEFVRSDSTQILQRVMAEARARSVRADVVVADIADGLKDSKTVQSFQSPILAEYPAQYIDPEHEWVSIRTSWQGIAWNTNLVSDAEAPQTWEALLDPKWKGKLAWTASSGTGAPRLITHFRKIWGEDKTLDYLHKLKAQDIRTLPGSVRSALDQIIAGEKAIGVSMAMHHIAISRSQGAPIYGAEPEPAMARSGALALVKNMPHPHGAMLFVDFLLDKDGAQKVFRETQYNPAHPAVKPLPEMAWIQPNLNGKEELLMTPNEENEMQEKSAELYKQIFR